MSTFRQLAIRVSEVEESRHSVIGVMKSRHTKFQNSEERDHIVDQII
jgi:hypothetical protein